MEEIVRIHNNVALTLLLKGPVFTVTPADDPSRVLTHSTSSGVWCETLKLIKKKANVSVSGPEMFGFSDATVKMLIQELPNAKKCTGYAWRNFDSGSGDTETPEKGESSTVSSPAPTVHSPAITPPQTSISQQQNTPLNITPITPPQVNDQPEDMDSSPPYNSPPSSPGALY